MSALTKADITAGSNVTPQPLGCCWRRWGEGKGKPGFNNRACSFGAAETTWRQPNIGSGGAYQSLAQEPEVAQIGQPEAE
jgi:hypothetical protein